VGIIKNRDKMDERLVFFGRNNAFNITKVCLEELLKNKDKYSDLMVVVSDDNHDSKNSVEYLSKSNNIPVFYEPDNEVNSPYFVKKIQDFNPTKGVVVQFPKIFKKDLIDSFKGNLINLHRGWPYRGGSIDQRIIIHGLNKYNIVLHHIDEGVDTGNIINKVTFSVDSKENGYSLDNKVTEFGLKLFQGGFIPLLGGEIPKGEKQDKSKTIYGKKGCVDYQPDALTMEAKEIESLIRAFNHPRNKPRILAQLPNKEIRKIEILEKYTLEPGKTEYQNSFIYVGTKKGTIKIEN
jgi:methionyl-tRNA formyltransferase